MRGAVLLLKRVNRGHESAGFLFLGSRDSSVYFPPVNTILGLTQQHIHDRDAGNKNTKMHGPRHLLNRYHPC